MESAVRFVYESNLLIELAVYLIHRYFVFVANESDVRTTELELSTCLFQFSHKTRQTVLLYAYFTPKVDFKRKFNYQRSLLYEWRLTARTIRKFRIGPSIRIESRIGRTIRNRIKSRSFASPYILRVSCNVKLFRKHEKQFDSVFHMPFCSRYRRNC